MNPQQNQNMPSPMLFMETAFAFQRTAILKAGVQLKVFTAIGEGKETPEQIADRCGASGRGIRILCDNLVISGFLTKEADRYQLTPDSAMFLDQKSPAYLGGALEFLLNPELVQSFDDFAAAVRKGGTMLPGQGSIEPENPVWVQFARAMAPLMGFPAQLLVKLVDPDSRA